MIIISEASYPVESVREVVKRFSELPALPDFISMQGPYGISVVGVGFRAIAIYEFDDSKYTEAMEYIQKRFASYIGIPGFTYSANIWMEAVEAIKVLGLI
jgi:hypothetical protein